jgi:hypothetical protein
MGFVPKPRTRTVVCDFIEAEEGSDPLTATIQVNLSFEQVDYCKELMRNSATTTYTEVFELIAPFVVAWNAMAFDRASGELAPVPPPAEVGVDAFRAVDPLISNWLLLEIAQAYRGGPEREEKSQPSDGTPATDGDANSISSPPNGQKKASKTRRRPTVSPALSATT